MIGMTVTKAREKKKQCRIIFVGEAEVGMFNCLRSGNPETKLFAGKSY